MVLNYIWISFFIIAFVVAVCKLIFTGDMEIFTQIMDSTYASAKSGFEISLGLTGVLSLWMGIMKIGERGGMIDLFSRGAAPLFGKLFPDIPKGHPASGSILMNVSANMLGLDNAATPFGLKAMQELQEINAKKDQASNPMIMFLVMNASGLTLIPVTIMVYRAQMGAANPADVFIPIMITTFAATLVGVLSVCIKQKINVLDKHILGFFLGMMFIIGGTVAGFRSMPQEQANMVSSLIANILLLTIIVLFIVKAMIQRVNIFEAFIDGAKDGFKTAVTIIPYLIAILVGVSVFSRFGSDGFSDGGIEGIGCSYGHGHPLGGRNAYGHHETVERERRPRYDDRCHADFRSRFVCGQNLVGTSGSYRYYVLYCCRVLRSGEHKKQPLHCSLCSIGGSGRCCRRNFRGLSVFRLIRIDFLFR